VPVVEDDNHQMNKIPSARDQDPVDFETVQTLLDTLPDSLAPLDAGMLDGFLCGVLLQPRAVAASHWLPYVVDIDARLAPADFPLERLHALIGARCAEIDRAIVDRQWFDPWVYELGDDQAAPGEAVMPWTAGFITAMALYPALMDLNLRTLVEPLALILQYADADDLEDADEILEAIADMEPPRKMAEAVEDLVRAVLLIADVTRPKALPDKSRRQAPARPRPR
jgi:uncharacterized protein